MLSQNILLDDDDDDEVVAYAKANILFLVIDPKCLGYHREK